MRIVDPKGTKLTQKASPSDFFKSGERIGFTVHKALGNGNYLISVRGRFFSVHSTEILKKGEIREALTKISGRKIYLKLLPNRTDVQSLARTPYGRFPIDDLTRMQFIRQAAAEALLRTELQMQPALLEDIGRWIRRMPLRERTAARFLAVLADKNLPLTENYISTLLPLFLGDESNSESGTDKEKKKKPRDDKKPQDDKASRIPDASDPDDTDCEEALQLFNHSRGDRFHWVFSHFTYSGDKPGFQRPVENEGTTASGTEVKGVIRLCYYLPGNTESMELVKYIVCFDEPWSIRFLIEEVDGTWKCSLYGSERLLKEKGRIATILPELGQKLQNVGVVFDDTIKENAQFNGFDGVDDLKIGIDRVI